MTKDQFDIQCSIALAASETWLVEYRHHVGIMGERALPFERFRLKANRLTVLLNSDPDGRRTDLDAQINRLCEEIGA